MEIVCQMSNRVFISLGSNKGNRLSNLKNAVERISEYSEIIHCSPVYETPPWGFESSSAFLNAVIEIETALSPHMLLDELLKTEKILGRDRSSESIGYQDRTIDLDILLFGSEILDNEKLEIPHPRMRMRKFVLIPLNDIAPNLYHPTENKSISELLQTIEDNSTIEKTEYEL